MLKGIDVSEHQGIIDFNKVKNEGIKFVIIRAGFGGKTGRKDYYFETNYKNAKAAGLLVGAYWYNYAKTPEGAKIEAEKFKEALKGKTFEMPIYYDVEEASLYKTKTKEQISEIIDTFLKDMEKDGYFVGLYKSKYYLINYTTPYIRQRYSIWIAEWGNKQTYKAPLWQYSSKGKIDGIYGNVDMDILNDENIIKIIKEKGFNGFKKGCNASKLAELLKRKKELEKQLNEVNEEIKKIGG